MRPLLLLDAVPYARAYADQVFVVKLSGELLGDPAALRLIARDVAVLHRLRVAVVVVHGGGPQLDALCEQLGLEVERVAGRRVTSDEVLDAAKMVLRGQLNLDLVTALDTAGERAVGLSGVDAGIVTADRRPPTLVTDDAGERVAVDFGSVGDVSAVDTRVLRAVLDSGAIPVLSPLALGAEGQVLNVNADTVAAEVAVALGAAKLLLLTRVAGIYEDPTRPTSLLHWTDLDDLDRLGQRGAFSGGMRPKIAAVRRALTGGVPRVHVIDGRREGALLEEVFTTDGCGTLVVEHADEAPAEPL